MGGGAREERIELEKRGSAILYSTPRYYSTYYFHLLLFPVLDVHSFIDPSIHRPSIFHPSVLSSFLPSVHPSCRSLHSFIHPTSIRRSFIHHPSPSSIIHHLFIGPFRRSVVGRFHHRPFIHHPSIVHPSIGPFRRPILTDVSIFHPSIVHSSITHHLPSFIHPSSIIHHPFIIQSFTHRSFIVDPSIHRVDSSIVPSCCP